MRLGTPKGTSVRNLETCAPGAPPRRGGRYRGAPIGFRRRRFGVAGLAHRERSKPLNESSQPGGGGENLHAL